MSDATVPVRQGETVDADALRRWLATAVPEFVSADSALEVRQYPAGFSNLTYRVDVSGARGASAGTSLVLRRPPRGVKAGVAHDMGREHAILSALYPLGLPVPRPIARCDDDSVIGAPFYVMEHVDGVIVRGNAPPVLVALGDEMPNALASMSRTFVATLAQLHDMPVSDEPLRALARPGSYVERQVTGWTKRWLASRTSDVPTLDAVATWLAEHRPPDRAHTLVHNDFKFDNLVLDPSLTRVRAILDWEMATVGDPLMDLGTSLAYWVEPSDAPVLRALGLGATAMPGSASRADIARMYGERTGRDVSDIAYYHAFGLFKVAVIAQQIYARHLAGLTADPRFAHLGAVVEALGDAATCARSGALRAS